MLNLNFCSFLDRLFVVNSSPVVNIIVTVVNIIVTVVKMLLNLNFCSFLDWLFAVNSSPSFFLLFHCLQNSGFSRNLKDKSQTCKIVSLCVKLCKYYSYSFKYYSYTRRNCIQTCKYYSLTYKKCKYILSLDLWFLTGINYCVSYKRLDQQK